MSQERLSMRKIREILRLKWECRLSNRAVAQSCSVSPSTVSDYVHRARRAGLRWPLPDDLDEDRLFQLLFPSLPVQLPGKFLCQTGPRFTLNSVGRV